MIISIVFILIMLGYTQLLDNDNGENWKDNAREQQKNMNEIATIDVEDDIDEQIRDNSVYLCEKIEYCIENDILYGTQSVWTFMFSAKFLLGFIIIVMLILAQKIISIEEENNMWEKINYTKYTLKKIFISKIETIFVNTILFVFLGYLVMFVIGFIVFGKVNYFYVVGEERGIFEKISSFESLKGYFIALCIISLIYSILTMIIETFFSKQKITIVLVTITFLLNNVLISMTEKIKMAKILPFYYLKLSKYVYGIDREYVKNIIYLLSLLVILLIAEYMVLVRKKSFKYGKI